MNDRELDALVAEKVMGLVRTDRKQFKEDAWISSQFANDNRAFGDSLPNYSSDIAAAWQVVERVKYLKPDPTDWGLEKDHPQDFVVSYRDGVWTAGWQPMNLDGVATVEAEADTTPRAICLAALKAVGVEI